MSFINTAALYHRAGQEYRYYADGEVHVRLRSAAGDLDGAEVWYGNRYDKRNPLVPQRAEMRRTLWDGTHDWFEASFRPVDPRVCYYIRVWKDNRGVNLFESGLRDEVTDNRNEWFFFAYVQQGWEHQVPLWARGIVVYEIFVDRFARGDGTDDSELEPWGGRPRGEQAFFGGNLWGIRERIPYLKDLGVEAVYLTPIFAARTNHRYDTVDYYAVDALVGTKDDLRALADALHNSNMKLILDGVFNHCSPGFFAFQDLIAHGESSPYREWFFPHGFPVSVEMGNYLGFADLPTMPKLNLACTAAQEYFCAVGQYWLKECHADGWRLDVANELDPEFIRKFRQAMKDENPAALLVGEIWNNASEWLQGDMLDGVMQYPSAYPLWSCFSGGRTDARAMMGALCRTFTCQPHAELQAGWPILGTHDTPRFLTRAHEDVRKLRAAAFVQFLCPGSPLVYYGDELEMDGADDPDCRRCLPWDAAAHGGETFDWYHRLIALRKKYEALRLGRFVRLDAGGASIAAWLREYRGQTVLAAANLSGEAAWCALPLPGRIRKPVDALTGKPPDVKNGSAELSLAPWECAMLVDSEGTSGRG